MRGLEHRHQPTGQHRAAARSCGADQFGLQRPVDDVGDPQVGPQQSGGDRQPRMAPHARRGGVDQSVGARRPLRQVGQRVAGGPVGAEALAQRRGQCVRALLVGVEDGDRGRAHVEQGVPDRGTGPAGADQHDAVSTPGEQSAPDGFGEAGRVGVVAERLAVVEQHGVHRAQRFGLGGEAVQVLDHDLLARMGDVQAAVAEGAGGVQQVADGGGGQRQFVQVDAAVEVAQAQFVGCAFVQCGRQGRRDARSHQTHETAGLLLGHVHHTSSRVINVLDG